MHFVANLVVSISLLCLSVGNFNYLSPSLYEYCPFVIILQPFLYSVQVCGVVLC